MISLKKHIQQRPRADFRPAIHTHSQEVCRPLSLKWRMCLGPKAKHSTAAAHRHHTTHPLSVFLWTEAWTQRSNYLNYPGTIQGQTRVTMKTGLTTQMLLPRLRRALALSQLTPTENMSIALKESPSPTPLAPDNSSEASHQPPASATPRSSATNSTWTHWAEAENDSETRRQNQFQPSPAETKWTLGKIIILWWTLKNVSSKITKLEKKKSSLQICSLPPINSNK